MDFLFIFAVLEIVGKDEIWITPKELFSAIFGGILTGVSAIIIYVIQKRMEKRLKEGYSKYFENKTNSTYID